MTTEDRIPIRVRLHNDQWRATLDHPKLGVIVVAGHRDPWRCMSRAARFIEVNLPDLSCYFEDGSPWPDTSARHYDNYWGEWA